MTIIAIDFETKDPYIGRKFGPGWVYKYHQYQDCDFEILGMSWASDKESGYTTDQAEMIEIVNRADYICAHNLSYDLGCLLVVGGKKLINRLYGRVVCTMIAAKLIDCNKMSYSLDNLSKSLLKEKKGGLDMFKEVWELGIYPLTKKEQKEGRNDFKTLAGNRLAHLKNWTMNNLDIIQDKSYDTVAKYAVKDAVLCYKLLTKLLQLGDQYYESSLVTFTCWSKLVHVTQDYTVRGICVDLEKADEASQYLQPKIADGIKKIKEAVGFDFNINSSKALPKVFQALGLKTGKSPTGQPSVTKEILEAESHPVAKLIRDTKQYINIKNNFIDKMVRIQQFTLPEGEDERRKFGRVHPSFSALAAKTGRFSSQGPNLQQIPKRNKELGPLCRGIFVPEQGKKWYSLDFSNQEGRLQVHYAYITKCDGSDILRDKLCQDPNYDIHKEVSKKVSELSGHNIERGDSKVINLGLSYGMGEAKLCKSLGLPTATINKWGRNIEVAGEQANKVLSSYHEMFPYLKQIIAKVTNAAKAQGYIRTLGGRIVTNDRAFIGGKLVKFTHKAFNQLIQGSALDQTAICMIDAYEAGLPVNLTVHDELNMSGNKKEAKQLQKIMQENVKLEVPSVTDIGEGDTWWDAC